MNKIEEHIKEIEKNIMEYQHENGFETAFDFMNESLASIKALVKDYDSLHLVMPCTTFEHTAVDLKDGSTAVWTDGLSLNSDNDRHCQYKLQRGKKYRVVLYEA